MARLKTTCKASDRKVLCVKDEYGVTKVRAGSFWGVMT